MYNVVLEYMDLPATFMNDMPKYLFRTWVVCQKYVWGNVVCIYSFHLVCFLSLLDNERDTGAQDKNLWIPRHRGWRGQQTYPENQGNQ